MADMFSMFSSLKNIDWVTVLTWGGACVIFVGGALGLFIYLMFKKKFKKVYEIDLVSHRLICYNAKIKRDLKTQSERLWIGKYKKNIERPQQEDFIYKGNRECIILLKDNNGFHHTLRFPTKDEIVGFYKSRGIDITAEFIASPNNSTEKIENPHFKYHQIYAMPNPHEDLDWLGKEIDEANKEFRQFQSWWAHPNVMVVGCAVVCLIMFIMTMILSKKLA